MTKFTDREREIALAIATRTHRLNGIRGKKDSAIIAALVMIVHRQVVPLDLERLLTCPDDDFIHDLEGLRDHFAAPYVAHFNPLSPPPLALQHGWMPRCAVGAPKAEPIQ